MANSAVAHGAFSHQQLPDPENHFRLLRVTKCAPHTIARAHQNNNGADLECELTTWPIIDAPPYRTISYTWGDSNNTAWIQINGKNLQVRQNCEDVLRQVYRHSGSDRYIWVDAICINQTDYAEKNIQVAMMGSIYQKAELVLACLGAHDEYSRALVQNLKQNSELFRQAGAYYSVPKSERKTNLAFEWKIRTWHLRQKPEQLVRQFFEFLCRPYFQRVWTFPEMRLARSVEILCGDDDVVGPALSGLSLLFIRGLVEQFGSLKDADIDMVESIDDDPFSKQHLPIVLKLGRIALSLLSQKMVRRTPLSRLFPLWQSVYALSEEGHENLNQVGFDVDQGRLTHGHLWAMTTDQSSRDPLWDILKFTLDLQCEDPRDRVYAVLAIVDWSPDIAQPIQPDYNSDVYDLVRAVLPWLWSTPRPELPDARRLFEQGRKIVSALRLEVQFSPKLAKGIDLRRRIHTKQLAPGAMTSGPPSISVVGFRGFKVLREKGLQRLDISPHWTKKHEKDHIRQCCLLPSKDEDEVESNRKVNRRIIDLAEKPRENSKSSSTNTIEYVRFCLILLSMEIGS
ncbi:heterokaryon incompatibility protein-domain-containing protein [Xylaria arbuscula]|nr:heterokaryon incompatibility protein-domain-containing protein [Xylaria arbuscula]